MTAPEYRRPVCGNDPRVRLLPGDLAAIAEFKTYLADRAAVAEFRAYLADRKQAATNRAAHPNLRDAGPPHDGTLCLPEGVGGWLCRYPLGDGHPTHHPYVEGEYLR